MELTFTVKLKREEQDMAKTIAELSVAIAGLQSGVTDAKNAVLSAVSRVEGVIADLKEKVTAGGDVEDQVNAINAATAELSSVKTAIDKVEPA